jgi:hypothetical protein
MPYLPIAGQLAGADYTQQRQIAQIQPKTAFFYPFLLFSAH